MTRLSQLLLPTERQPPADAEAVSHQLMVRAGLVRQMGAGLWSWLPAGWRVHQKVVAIVREEMERIGAQEVLMPVLQPAELWKRTGRYDAIQGELFRLKDRKDADMVLAMTHEEAMTSHVAQIVRSYRDLPFSLFQFQVKERDEPRPRAGVLRTREFVMKDAYTFDRDEAGLQEHYERYREAYARVYDRSGLRWYEVESDTGMMGGKRAHEYMAPCAAGEDDVVLAGPDGASYSANVEVASADAQPIALPPAGETPVTIETPGTTTIAALAEHLDRPAGSLLKAFPVVVTPAPATVKGEVPAAKPRLVLVLLRGDHEVVEIKLEKALGGTVRQASEQEIRDRIGPPGFLGPIGSDVPVLLDAAAEATTEANDGGGWVVGANVVDQHLDGVVPGRDFAYEIADVRAVVAGDTVDGQPVTIEPAIEVGNIFQLMTRYSEPLGATFLDEEGKEQPIVMGSYGIGPARIAAAAVEQFHDEQGISWPKAIAPFDIEVVALGKQGTDEQLAAAKVYDELTAAGFDVLLDDRNGGAGQKLTDAELLGCPLRITVGKRSLAEGRVEAQIRRGQETIEGGLALDGLADAVRELWERIP
ncbi:Prolyl-tRNA synthetase [Patulibacter medicamentivorans]|uniref:Proline--tRNA ligase n=1 Tax=Patulibacter medicamentivorans TaxID=1097667 RepID=H0EBE8_9ACTN|nr:proline--tRNA ligase [Patulibacter medicamentivorans]EHN09024.1 Prolyl-tRNA synthetase [Patulibacter medicamentivorans]